MTMLMWALAGYVLGSIPFGVIITRLGGAGDVRSIGSGNIGATNVLRTGRKGLAVATLLLDAAKGAVAVLLGQHFGGDVVGSAAGAAAFVGHLYPVWLRFKGGKGVATLLGVTLALSPWAGLGFIVAWLGVAVVSRISSLGGMSAGFAAAAVLAVQGQTHTASVVALLAFWVLFTHRENIARLRAGTEPKIGKKG